MGQGQSCGLDACEAAAAECQGGPVAIFLVATDATPGPARTCRTRAQVTFPGRAETPLSGEDPSTAARPQREIAPSAGVPVTSDLEQPSLPAQQGAEEPIERRCRPESPRGSLRDPVCQQPSPHNIKPQQTRGAPPPRLFTLPQQLASSPRTAVSCDAHKNAPGHVQKSDSSQTSDWLLVTKQCGATTNSHKDAEVLRSSSVRPVRLGAGIVNLAQSDICEEECETNPPGRLEVPDSPFLLKACNTCSAEVQPPSLSGPNVALNLPGAIRTDSWRSRTLTQYAARRQEELRAERQRQAMLATISNVPKDVMSAL